MPRKTKEINEEKQSNLASKEVKKETKSAKSTKSKKSSVKAETSKKTSAKAKASKKETTKSEASKKSTKKATQTRATKKSAKRTTSTASKKAKKSDLVSVIEYYDLPYRYNQTIVKILAQTPNMLFIYWDISDNDRKAFEEHYGNDFFSKTKPVLIIHNETMNYSFEIEINDFANSWYLHVNDANCKYVIELGRRPYSFTPSVNQNYIYIASSNEMDAPNNHILFEKFNPNVTYKNTKTGEKSAKDFSTLSNYKNMQKIYNIYDLYKKIYKDELFNEITTTDLTNPSSLSSSSFK